MKHLKRIFENTQIGARFFGELPDDIQDAILNIEDELGKPRIYKKNMNGITTYTLKWDTAFTRQISTFTQFNETFEKISKARHDIGSVIGRLSKNYESNFLFKDGVLTFTIKTKTPFQYNFIKQIDTEKKVVYLNKSEIIRFFTKYGPLQYIKSLEEPDNALFSFSVEIKCKSKDCTFEFGKFERVMQELLSKTSLQIMSWKTLVLYGFCLFEVNNRFDRLEYKLILVNE